MASEASQVSHGDAGAPGQAAASSLSDALMLLCKRRSLASAGRSG
jgi:hypothetical protein